MFLSLQMLARTYDPTTIAKVDACRSISHNDKSCYSFWISCFH